MADTVDLTSPLTETTRKERRLLLIMSVVLLATVQGGLRPTRIGQLGIDFLPEHLASMLAILFAVYAYILVAFIIGAAADSRLWEAQFFDSGRKLDAQIEQSRHSVVQESGDVGVGFATATDDFRKLVEGAHVHLRGQTLAEAKRVLVIAEEAGRLSARWRGKPAGETVDAAFNRVIHGRSEALPTSPAEIGVLSALIQVEMEGYSSYLRAPGRIRACLVGLIRRRYLNDLIARLRYTRVSLKHEFFVLKRLLRFAGVRAVRMETFEAQLEHINTHRARSDFDWDAFVEAELIALSSAFGVRSAREEMQICIEAMATDVSRSMRRFSRKALWEQRVPALIGGLILALSLLHASIDGLLAMQ